MKTSASPWTFWISDMWDSFTLNYAAVGDHFLFWQRANMVLRTRCYTLTRCRRDHVDYSGVGYCRTFHNSNNFRIRHHIAFKREHIYLGILTIVAIIIGVAVVILLYSFDWSTFQ